MHMSHAQRAPVSRPHRPVSLRPTGQGCGSRTVVAPDTGPLEVLAGRRVLVLADVENLSFSAQKRLGFEIQYASLAERLAKLTTACTLHAFFSADGQRSEAQRAYFSERGWYVHDRPIEVIQTHAGEKNRANIDTLMLFQAGLLCSRSQANTVVLASGDGDLVCDLAGAIGRLPTPRAVVTLSLAGSTSWRLNARDNPHIAANLEIGHDCLRAIGRS